MSRGAGRRFHGDQRGGGAMTSCFSPHVLTCWTSWCWLQQNPTLTALYVFLIYFVHSLRACPELCSCPETSNQVTCTDAGLTEIPRSLPPSLTTLDLSQNSIHTLSETSLSALRSVVNLKLKENEIDTIHNGAFQSVDSLQTLDLSNNKLTELTELTFQGVAGLLHLDLSANQLTNVDGAFTSMTELSRLDLRDNQLTTISQFMLLDQKNLRYLLLAGNKISTIDKKAFKNLDKLTYLVLKGNPISQVARFKFYSYFLSYVDLSECGLSHVPRGLPNSIRYLQLRQNNITQIRRHTFQDCPFVSILVLDDNGITEINEQAFEQMTYLQQLWLNNNLLRVIPANIPISLQRLLMDQNNVERLTPVFPRGSQLTDLSLMGNNITYVSHDALYSLPLLQSLDLSNNHIAHVYGNTFLNSSRLETLQLSKNPLQYFHSRSFRGLKLLQTLNLAYISTVVAMHPDCLQDLQMLSKLDLDSSHWIIQTLLASEELLGSLGSVEDLSMQSSDLTTLRTDFVEYFQKLNVLHISSTRWHCDKSLIWFRNWLLVTEVHIENKNDIACFSPHGVNGRSLTSLTDYEFAATTTLRVTTMLPTPPGKLSTFPSLPPTTPTTPTPSTTTPSTTTSTTTTTSPVQTKRTTASPSTTKTTTEDYDYDSGEDYAQDPSPPVDPEKPFDIDEFYDVVYGNGDDSTDRPPSSRYPIWRDPSLRSTVSPGSGNSKGYDPLNSVPDGNLQIKPLPESELDGGLSGLPTASDDGASEQDSTSGPKKSTIIIIVATSIATIVVAAVLILIIVYLSRKDRRRKKNARETTALAKNRSKHKDRTKSSSSSSNKKRTRKKKEPSHQNGIKYKTRNDVLYFMPKSQESGGTSDSLQTNNSKEGMTLIPGRDINHEGPLRVYKWEDF